ncbi:efflux RND transporter periplasmic adaptor subunit [Aliikangiella sp. G2MR2-5]|uniref:efflux RND transporter periplasmic adaptor subunit n=1 Tax=Aliikangiella sp. G2MR2-5 TaxID=2788943 RepID=UPI0018AC45FC|nr:efflux RND transporter periplasmic adaptor subunit [Aliikangiella sp. G2MR2-5]
MKAFSQSRKYLNSILRSCGMVVTLSVTGSALAAENEKSDAKLVSLEQIKQESVAPSIWVAANVINRLSAELASEQSGKVSWILDVGDTVKKGDAVAKLDSRELILLLQEKKVQISRQSTQVEYLNKQHTRLLSLLKKNNTSAMELDRVQRDLNIARQELDALKLQLKRLTLDQEQTVIRAPFEGQINRRFSQIGEYVSLGSPLVELVNPKQLDISVAAPIELASYIKENDRVLVKAGEQLHNANIRNWSPTGDVRSRTFTINIDATSLPVMGGAGVTVSLPKGENSITTLVPRDALLLREKQAYIVTVDDNLTAQKIPVEIGHGVAEWIGVYGDIDMTKRVVVRGAESIQSGDKVRLSNNPINVAVNH